MLRRSFLASCIGAGLALAGCSGTTGAVTVADIINTISSQCKFKADVQSITAVIATLVAGFNVTLGLSATVATAIAKQVEDLVCAAVATQLAQMKANNADASGEFTVIVNGVSVHGALVA